jgi:hypothetical protein
MLRTTLAINGRNYQLAQGTDLPALKTAIEDAVAAGGKFVDVIVVGNVAVSILASPGLPIFFTTREVEADDRDTGDVADPFDVTAWEIDGLM